MIRIRLIVLKQSYSMVRVITSDKNIQVVGVSDGPVNYVLHMEVQEHAQCLFDMGIHIWS